MHAYVTRRRAASEADQTCPFLARTAHALTVRLAYQTRRIDMLIGATTILRMALRLQIDVLSLLFYL